MIRPSETPPQSYPLPHTKKTNRNPFRPPFGKPLATIAFLAYFVLMAWELLIGPYRLRLPERRMNLTPLATLKRTLSNLHRFSAETVFINLAGNVLAFMPLGFLLPLLFPTLKSAWRAFTTCALLILLAESAQYALRVGVFDVDDLLLNLIGCALGWSAFRIWDRPKSPPKTNA